MEHRHLVLEERVRGDGWDDDAIVADSTTGVFAGPSKIREVDFRGEYFTSRGRHFVLPSPQRRPVLWQAGASEQGREFAAKHAESVLGVFPTVQAMRSYSDDIRARAQRHGRNPEELKLIFGLQTVVDHSHDRAVEKCHEFTSLVRFESALAIIFGHTGVDFSQFDLDDDIAELVVPELQERARFRTTYSGTTLRGNLLED